MVAHIRESDKAQQSVYEHSHNTAKLAYHFLISVGLPSVGKLVGLLHDIGKLKKEFQDYLFKVIDIRRGSIDHSYAGAKYLS